MVVAVNQAMEHIETQALRHNGRRRNTTRKPKDKSWKAPVEAEAEMQIAVGANRGDGGAGGGAQVSLHRAHHRSAPGDAPTIRLPCGR